MLTATTIKRLDALENLSKKGNALMVFLDSWKIRCSGYRHMPISMLIVGANTAGSDGKSLGWIFGRTGSEHYYRT